jgi:L-seryl-tRNA(Ser) seleniumtransferase
LPASVITDCVREVIAETRADILAGRILTADVERISASVRARAAELRRPSLRRVVNASGIVIHTNLGRSVLPQAAIDAVVQVASGYSTLEYDTDNMRRGSRIAHYEHLVCVLSGAQAALAVNNNAAAVMMILSEFAGGREAIVSRGELVEIGGSFRIPDIMRLSNAKMIEVGTTNKTHSWDYDQAITTDTGMLLKVHPSNYRMLGFTESVSIKELRQIADDENKRRKLQGHDDTVLVYEDLGSGALVHLDCSEEYREPTVRESLNQGCDLISFSGDKLLGGPQAGIIVGSKHLIDRLKKSPLARVLRLDKLTLAALEATLRHYLDSATATQEIPTLRMLSEQADKVKKRAESLKALLEQNLPKGCAKVAIVREVSHAGGGALPMCDIESFAVCLQFIRGNAQDCEHYLITERDQPVVPRIRKETLLCDARTLLSGDEVREVAEALGEYFENLNIEAGVEGNRADES